MDQPRPFTAGSSLGNMKEIIDIVKKEFRKHCFGLQYEDPNKFLRCQWQRGPGRSRAFLCFRWLLFLYFGSTLAYNVCQAVGQRLPGRAPWFMYMTYWGYALCTAQALYGACLVSGAAAAGASDVPADAQEKKPRTPQMAVELRLYWVLHTVALDMAISISSIFWVAIYDPAEHQLDFLTLDNHVLNSVAMGLEFLVVSHPVRLLHVVWPAAFLVSYFLFSVVNYFLGGTQIYAVLDWDRPLRTGAICFSAVCYLLFVHVSLWVLHLARRQVAERCTCCTCRPRGIAETAHESTAAFLEHSEV